MRTITTDTIIQNIKEMCIEANYSLTSDVKDKLYQAAEEENSPLGRQILSQLKENLQIAKDDEIPICQDTGMAVVFLRIGQDVHIEGQNLEDAVNEGIRQGYIEGYLRKSVVSDPILRENTKDNTPGVIHYEIIAGENIEITVAPKGFGSENMSRVCMLKPADGIEGVKNAVIETVKIAGPNACPPVVVGVGVGGTFEKCAFLVCGKGDNGKPCSACITSDGEYGLKYATIPGQVIYYALCPDEFLNGAELFKTHILQHQTDIKYAMQLTIDKAADISPTVNYQHYFQEIYF